MEQLEYVIESTETNLPDSDEHEIRHSIQDAKPAPKPKKKRKPVPLLYFFSCESTADDGHWALVAAKNEDQAREILEAHPWGEENGPFKLEKMPGLNNHKAQLITWESPTY